MKNSKVQRVPVTAAPLRQQVANNLRTAIIDGRFQPGGARLAAGSGVGAELPPEPHEDERDPQREERDRPEDDEVDHQCHRCLRRAASTLSLGPAAGERTAS